MPSLIFKELVPREYVLEVLEKICLKTDNYYQLDINGYKKLLYYNYNEEFIETLKRYYSPSKQFYLTRELTYNSFTNIIRQICKSINIGYENKIHYNKSKYGIIYLIYYNNII